ncbi:GNAT family N-acetyltransferase [Elusimicrobiota bacterium]
MIFETARLLIRKAEPLPSDVDLLYSVWTNPQVMKNVGFPQGLKTTKEKILSDIKNHDDTEFSQYLIVEAKAGNELIGECKLMLPDKEGVSETDVKLLPKYWGKGYGTEIKKGLICYLFKNTDCSAVQATPNKGNIASVKMQEAVGGKRVGEGVWCPAHKSTIGDAVEVPHYIYRVFKEDWLKRGINNEQKTR